MHNPLVIRSGKARTYNHAPNEQMNFIVSGNETAEKFDFVEAEFAYLGGPPLHVHPYQDEAHYILKGQLRYQIGEETFELSRGDSVYIPQGTAHAWVNLQQEPAQIIGFLTPGGGEGFFHTLANLPADQQDIESLARLAQEYGTEIVGSPLAIHLGLA